MAHIYTWELSIGGFTPEVCRFLVTCYYLCPYVAWHSTALAMWQLNKLWVLVTVVMNSWRLNAVWHPITWKQCRDSHRSTAPSHWVFTASHLAYVPSPLDISSSLQPLPHWCLYHSIISQIMQIYLTVGAFGVGICSVSNSLGFSLGISSLFLCIAVLSALCSGHSLSSLWNDSGTFQLSFMKESATNLALSVVLLYDHSYSFFWDKYPEGNCCFSA